MGSHIQQLYNCISIHALLAESDQAGNVVDTPVCISIHALLAESDEIRVPDYAHTCTFLSTLSLRRATFAITDLTLLPLDNFYPRSPCGERLQLVDGVACRVIISIHALLAESDKRALSLTRWNLLFLSTLSLRRATSSIATDTGKIPYFYPRSPCGERHFAD